MTLSPEAIEKLLAVRELILCMIWPYDEDRMETSVAGLLVREYTLEFEWKKMLASPISYTLIRSKAEKLLGVVHGAADDLIYAWPLVWGERYDDALDDRERAVVGAARVTDFLAEHGGAR